MLLSVLQYQTAVVRKDFNIANQLLPSIPEAELSNVARFLESQVSSLSGLVPLLTMGWGGMGSRMEVTRFSLCVNGATGL